MNVTNNTQPDWLREDATLTKAIKDHLTMVYGTARRVLRNEAQAADVVQETFFQFARDSHSIQGTVAGWLHRVATRRCYDLIRQESSRRRREHDFSVCHQAFDGTWADVEPVLDAALDDLGEDSRALLIQRYLEGRTTIQIAAARGWSQSTASRKITAALEELRHSLRQHGITVSVAILVPGLTHSVCAAPASAMAGLGKVFLTHSAASPLAATSTGYTKAVTFSLILMIGVGSYIHYKAGIHKEDSEKASEPPLRAIQIGKAVSNHVHVEFGDFGRGNSKVPWSSRGVSVAAGFQFGPESMAFSNVVQGSVVPSVQTPGSVHRTTAQTPTRTGSGSPSPETRKLIP